MTAPFLILLQSIIKFPSQQSILFGQFFDQLLILIFQTRLPTNTDTTNFRLSFLFDSEIIFL